MNRLMKNISDLLGIEKLTIIQDVMVQLKGLKGQCTGIKAMQFHIISQSMKSLKSLWNL